MKGEERMYQRYLFTSLFPRAQEFSANAERKMEGGSRQDFTNWLQRTTAGQGKSRLPPPFLDRLIFTGHS
jgi:hypothetical protein